MATSTCDDRLICKNDGLCQQDGEDEGTFKCVCVGYFAGISCEYHADTICNDKFNDISFCTNGGTCLQSSLIGHNGCNCINGFQGDRCQFPPGVKVPDYATAAPYAAKSSSKNSAAVWGTVLVSLLVVAVVAVAILVMRKRRRSARTPKGGPSPDLQLDADGSEIAAQFSPRKESHSPTVRLEDDDFEDVVTETANGHVAESVFDNTAYYAAANVTDFATDYPANHAVDHQSDHAAGFPNDHPADHAVDFPEDHPADNDHVAEDDGALDKSQFVDSSPNAEPIDDEEMAEPGLGGATIV